MSLAVIGPEAPLVAGMADALRAAGVATVGPSAAAARLEGSKVFAKHVMEDAGVPTARSRAVETVADGMAAVAELGLPVAIKADGLAAGKGVTVARDVDEARGALVAALEEGAFGAAGSVCLVEEGLSGPRGVADRAVGRLAVRPVPRGPRLQAGRRGQHRAEHRRHGRVLPGPRRPRGPGP